MASADGDNQSAALIERQGTGGRKKTESDLAYQSFYRKATPEEKEHHKSLKQLGTKAQQEYRNTWHELAVKNVKGEKQNTSSNRRTHIKKKIYKHFWQIVEAEGGLVNREFAVEVATNICSAAERAGPPCVMWDKDGKVMRYIYGVEGVEDEFTTLRQMVVKGDVDLPPETLRAALEAGEAEGFSANIPREAFGHFGHAAASVGEKGHSPAGPSPGVAVAANDAKALAVAAGDAKEPAASKQDQTVVNSAENGDLFVQAKNMMTKQLLEDSLNGTVDPRRMLLPILMQAMGPVDSKASSPDQAQADKISDAEKSEAQKSDAQTSDAQKSDAEPAAKVRPKPKPKSPEMTLFAECAFEGRKLDGMVRNGSSIVRQSKDPLK